MTITSLSPTLSSYLPISSTTNDTVTQAQNTSLNTTSTSDSSTVNDQVTLSTNSEIVNSLTASTNSSSQAYTQQGLLNAYYNVLENNAVNNPLFASDSNDSSSDNPFDLSSLSNNLPTGSTSDAASNTTSQTNDSADTSNTTDVNSNWAKILKQHPELSSSLTQSSFDQGIVNTLA